MLQASESSFFIEDDTSSHSFPIAAAVKKVSVVKPLSAFLHHTPRQSDNPHITGDDDDRELSSFTSSSEASTFTLASNTVRSRILSLRDPTERQAVMEAAKVLTEQQSSYGSFTLQSSTFPSTLFPISSPAHHQPLVQPHSQISSAAPAPARTASILKKTVSPDPASSTDRPQNTGTAISSTPRATPPPAVTQQQQLVSFQVTPRRKASLPGQRKPSTKPTDVSPQPNTSSALAESLLNNASSPLVHFSQHERVSESPTPASTAVDPSPSAGGAGPLSRTSSLSILKSGGSFSARAGPTATRAESQRFSPQKRASPVSQKYEDRIAQLRNAYAGPSDRVAAPPKASSPPSSAAILDVFKGSLSSSSNKSCSSGSGEADKKQQQQQQPALDAKPPVSPKVRLADTAAVAENQSKTPVMLGSSVTRISPSGEQRATPTRVVTTHLTKDGKTLSLLKPTLLGQSTTSPSGSLNNSPLRKDTPLSAACEEGAAVSEADRAASFNFNRSFTHMTDTNNKKQPKDAVRPLPAPTPVYASTTRSPMMNPVATAVTVSQGQALRKSPFRFPNATELESLHLPRELHDMLCHSMSVEGEFIGGTNSVRLSVSAPSTTDLKGSGVPEQYQQHVAAIMALLAHRADVSSSESCTSQSVAIEDGSFFQDAPPPPLALQSTPKVVEDSPRPSVVPLRPALVGAASGPPSASSRSSSLTNGLNGSLTSQNNSSLTPQSPGRRRSVKIQDIDPTTTAPTTATAASEQQLLAPTVAVDAVGAAVSIVGLAAEVLEELSLSKDGGERVAASDDVLSPYDAPALPSLVTRQVGEREGSDGEQVSSDRTTDSEDSQANLMALPRPVAISTHIDSFGSRSNSTSGRSEPHSARTSIMVVKETPTSGGTGGSDDVHRESSGSTTHNTSARQASKFKVRKLRVHSVANSFIATDESIAEYYGNSVSGGPHLAQHRDGLLLIFPSSRDDDDTMTSDNSQAQPSSNAGNEDGEQEGQQSTSRRKDGDDVAMGGSGSGRRGNSSKTFLIGEQGLAQGLASGNIQFMMSPNRPISPHFQSLFEELTPRKQDQYYVHGDSDEEMPSSGNMFMEGKVKASKIGGQQAANGDRKHIRKEKLVDLPRGMGMSKGLVVASFPAQGMLLVKPIRGVKERSPKSVMKKNNSVESFLDDKERLDDSGKLQHTQQQGADHDDNHEDGGNATSGALVDAEDVLSDSNDGRLFLISKDGRSVSFSLAPRSGNDDEALALSDSSLRKAAAGRGAGGQRSGPGIVSVSGVSPLAAVGAPSPQSHHRRDKLKNAVVYAITANDDSQAELDTDECSCMEDIYRRLLERSQEDDHHKLSLLRSHLSLKHREAESRLLVVAEEGSWRCGLLINFQNFLCSFAAKHRLLQQTIALFAIIEHETRERESIAHECLAHRHTLNNRFSRDALILSLVRDEDVMRKQIERESLSSYHNCALEDSVNAYAASMKQFDKDASLLQALYNIGLETILSEEDDDYYQLVHDVFLPLVALEGRAASLQYNLSVSVLDALECSATTDAPCQDPFEQEVVHQEHPFVAFLPDLSLRREESLIHLVSSVDDRPPALRGAVAQGLRPEIIVDFDFSSRLERSAAAGSTMQKQSISFDCVESVNRFALSKLHSSISYSNRNLIWFDSVLVCTSEQRARIELYRRYDMASRDVADSIQNYNSCCNLELTEGHSRATLMRAEALLWESVTSRCCIEAWEQQVRSLAVVERIESAGRCAILSGERSEIISLVAPHIVLMERQVRGVITNVVKNATDTWVIACGEAYDRSLVDFDERQFRKVFSHNHLAARAVFPIEAKDRQRIESSSRSSLQALHSALSEEIALLWAEVDARKEVERLRVCAVADAAELFWRNAIERRSSSFTDKLFAVHGSALRILQHLFPKCVALRDNDCAASLTVCCGRLIQYGTCFRDEWTHRSEEYIKQRALRRASALNRAMLRKQSVKQSLFRQLSDVLSRSKRSVRGATEQVFQRKGTWIGSAARSPFLLANQRLGINDGIISGQDASPFVMQSVDGSSSGLFSQFPSIRLVASLKTVVSSCGRNQLLTDHSNLTVSSRVKSLPTHLHTNPCNRPMDQSRQWKHLSGPNVRGALIDLRKVHAGSRNVRDAFSRCSVGFITRESHTIRRWCASMRIRHRRETLATCRNRCATPSGTLRTATSLVVLPDSEMYRVPAGAAAGSVATTASALYSELLFVADVDDNDDLQYPAQSQQGPPAMKSVHSSSYPPSPSSHPLKAAASSFTDPHGGPSFGKIRRVSDRDLLPSTATTRKPLLCIQAFARVYLSQRFVDSKRLERLIRTANPLKRRSNTEETSSDRTSAIVEVRRFDPLEAVRAAIVRRHHDCLSDYASHLEAMVVDQEMKLNRLKEGPALTDKYYKESIYRVVDQPLQAEYRRPFSAGKFRPTQQSERLGARPSSALSQRSMPTESRRPLSATSARSMTAAEPRRPLSATSARLSDGNRETLKEAVEDAVGAWVERVSQREVKHARRLLPRSK